MSRFIKAKVFLYLMNMKIILTIININLILLFGEANKYVVTRFPQLNVLYFQLQSLGNVYFIYLREQVFTHIVTTK